MEIYHRGSGDPEYTIIGSIHGDEPAGKKAIEKFLSEDHNFRRSVQFIVANEEALQHDKRYLEADLNRAFPGDLDSEVYEERLAAQIIERVKGTKILDIHTTHSYPLPFATCSRVDEVTKGLLESTGVKNAVFFSEGGEGALTDYVDGVIVESGFQGTQMAVENALGVMKNFLAAQEVIDCSFRRSEPNIFKQIETVKGDWEFTAENFKLVKEGEKYAENNDEELQAKKDFYPVLMSTNGYDGVLGFKAEKFQ